MGMKMEGGAAQATLALLKLAKEIAEAVVADPDQATVRSVFDRLCLETDCLSDTEPVRDCNGLIH
jgi:hypothetical protein